MAKWEKMTVGDLCDTISDTYRGDDKDVVLINTSDVLEGKVLNHQLIENKNLKGQFKKTFKKNDILYSEIRPANKRYAFVDFGDTDNYIASTKLMVLRPRKDVVRPRFLFSFLASKSVLEELQQLAETRSGTFPQITFSSELAPTPINVPDLETQDRIVGILDVIEGKISTNAEINKNLLQQLHVLYLRLFYDSAMDTPLGDVVATTSGGTPSRKHDEYYSDSSICWVKSKELLGNYIHETEEHINDLAIKKSSAKLLPEHSVLIAMYGATVGAYGVISKPMTCNQAVCALLCNENYPYTYLFQIAYESQQKFINLAVGSAQQNISQVLVKQLNLHSDLDIIQRFHDLALPMHQEIEFLQAENIRLSDLRDHLLPKLISGELDVSKVEI